MVSSSTAEHIVHPPAVLLSNSPTTTYDYSKQLLQTGAFADCTITCRGRSWPAHRNVLSPRCDFFKCCLDGRFSEARTRVIVMEDDEPIAVDGMIWYLYTLDYPALETGSGSGSDSGIEDEDSTTTTHNASASWRFDRLMYTIADKYGLTGLRELAGKSLLGKVDLVGQKEKELLKSMDGFVTLVEDLYTVERISDQLRALRTQIVASTCEAVTRHVRDYRLSGLMADVPEFAVELVEVLGKKREERRVMQREEDSKKEKARLRLIHIPMNDESDDEI